MSEEQQPYKVDEYAFWREALKDNYIHAMQEGAFQCGFWRTRNRDKSWSAVAIWKSDTGGLRILVNDKLVDPDDFVQRWNFTWQNPVTKGAYDAFRETGKWPGEIDVPAIGDNRAPDEFSELKDDIDDSVEQALKWLEAHKDLKTDEEADTAANWRDRLNKLGKKADAQRKSEKQPLAEKVKEIDTKFNAIVKKATGAADTIRNALTSFMRRKEEAERKRLAEERKAAEEERARQEAERKALEDTDIALAVMEPELPLLPPVQDVKIQAGGQFGRATGFRTKHVAVITDYRKALEHFADHPDVRAAVEKLCNSEARSKTRKDVPGVEFKEEKVAA